MTPILAQRQRPDRSFERIYRRHVGDVYRYALAVMRNQADAEDVTQTTFMNAYRAFRKGERPEKAQNWLIAIAHNVCRQRFRQSARRPHEVSYEDDIGDRYVEPEDDTPSAGDIRHALGHLAFNQRAALVMRELEGRSYAEIAEILELSPSAVETLIFRARRALREQLETALTCGEAELAISRQLDGRLGRKEKGALRAHLRQCQECARFARRQRAQRTALRSLGAIPLPASLSSFFGGGAAVGTGVAIKAATAVTIGLAVGGVGYEGVHQVVGKKAARPVPAAPETRVQQAATPEAASAPPAARPAAKGKARRRPQAPALAARNGKAHRKAHPSRPAYHGDASVAARHVLHPKKFHVPPARGKSHPVRAKPALPPGRAKARPHPKPLPGPFDAGPPAGRSPKN